MTPWTFVNIASANGFSHDWSLPSTWTNTDLSIEPLGKTEL